MDGSAVRIYQFTKVPSTLALSCPRTALVNEGMPPRGAWAGGTNQSVNRNTIGGVDGPGEWSPAQGRMVRPISGRPVFGGSATSRGGEVKKTGKTRAQTGLPSPQVDKIWSIILSQAGGGRPDANACAGFGGASEVAVETNAT